MAKKTKVAAKAQVSSKVSGSPPKANSDGKSVASYFRAIFKENPKLLHTRSNDELLQRWLKDHPGEKEVPSRIKNNLANVKSILRRKSRKKPGRKPAQPTAATPTFTAVALNASPVFDKRLEQLEEGIDDCLTLAKNLDRDSLGSVIVLLRRARNEVVWKLGGEAG